MKAEKWIRAGIIVSVIVLTVAACGKSQYPGFKKAENGVYIKYHKKGDGTVKPVVNSIVTLDMAYRLSDTTLFNSAELPEPLEFPVIEPTFIGDLYAALTLLHIGDSVTVVFPADSFFMVMAGMPELPEFVTAGEPIYFDISLKKIKSQEENLAEQTALLMEMKQQEQELLKVYLADNKITIQPLESGLYYIEEKKGSGPLPKIGDVLKVHFTVSMIDGFPLFSTYDREPMDIEFGQQFDTEGFDEALAYLQKGTKAKLIVPSHLAFDSIGRNQMIPPYTTMLYNVELVGIRSKAEVDRELEAARKVEDQKAQKSRLEEQSSINNFLKKNNITIDPRPSGMYYLETEKGTGKPAIAGKTVKVHYTLYNIEGKLLQSSKEMNQPFSFVVGQGQVIQGWDEGLLLMNEGGKARFILPSSLAYGGTARGEDIPAFSPLVFDVELLEVIE
ncbi:MAG: FKBP-type peptidyl-prolyl cis-trans isomerase [Bacteroidetes bacterium]|nr:FKBP-type peptidyl-prolyl cis-trans isomerase [Bacteroidota bacterium]